MADIALGSVERIIKLAFKINEAVGTVQQNEEECQALEEEVAILIANLLRLQVMEALNPAMNSALMLLGKALDGALKVVTNCQERPTFLHRLFTARDMARRLARVKDDIHRKVNICTLAITVEYCTVTVPCSSAHLPPLAQLHQDAGKLDMSYNSHARSGVNNVTTMSVTGSEVPYGPLSGITELTFSKLEATTQNISGENLAEGGGQTRVYTMQKIVFKIDMINDRSRARAMAVVARAHAGVLSMGITGDVRDMLEVVGSGVDIVSLVSCLRKKVGCADILRVEEVKDKEARPEPVVVVNTEEGPAGRRRRAREIFTKLLPKFVWSRTRTSISPPALSPAASHLFPGASPSSTAASAASPPSRAVEPLLPPVRTAPARRRRRPGFNMSRIRRLSVPATRRLPTTPELGVPRDTDGPVHAL